MAEIDDDISALRTVLRESDWAFESHQYSTEWQYTASCDRISRIVAHIDAQAAEIERLKAAQSMAPASAAHGEIALRWRVQADGLYAVDMMVSNLSTEAQAHAAMAYVQSLFAGDEMAGKH